MQLRKPCVHKHYEYMLEYGLQGKPWAPVHLGEPARRPPFYSKSSETDLLMKAGFSFCHTVTPSVILSYRNTLTVTHPEVGLCPKNNVIRKWSLDHQT